MRPLTIDLDELAVALDTGDIEHYLDLGSGQVVPLLSDSPDPDLLLLLEQDPERLLPIEPLSSRESLELMRDFLREVGEPHAYAAMASALEGRKPFKAFRHVLMGYPESVDLAQAMNRGLASIVSADATIDELFLAGMRAFELLDAKSQAAIRGKFLRRYRYELGELINIARAMTTERDVNKLLSVILEKSRFVTGADAGSIYVVEEPAPPRADEPPTTGIGKGQQLRFKLSQNESVTFESKEFVMPLSARAKGLMAVQSFTGFVVLALVISRAVNILA